MQPNLTLPGLGAVKSGDGLLSLETTSDGRFSAGSADVRTILTTRDRKVEFVVFAEHSLALVRSALGYPAYYPVPEVRVERPLRAVLMDLDGTSVRSEEFWIWIIQRSIASLIGDPHFELEDADLPFVSGHSVSEHLQYCINKYHPDGDLEAARRHYYTHTRREMSAILAGGGRANAFTPTPGLKDFLLELKSLGLQIGLVTSGLYEKAYPEILAAFRALNLGDPREFYDAIITAGYPLRQGEVGTLGELSPKPHPWLYAETSRVGLGIPYDERARVIGIEDSGAGVVSIRLAGFTALGLAGGNIVDSGAESLCARLSPNFEDILAFITNKD